jgi:CRP-like cAMP-binding protein
LAVSYVVATSSDLTPARSQLLRQVRRIFRHAGIGAEPPPSRAALLAGLTLFEALSEGQIKDLEAQLLSHRLEAGTRLFTQGDQGHSIYVVRSGVLDVSRQDGGVTWPVGRIGPGEYLGEVSLMSGAPHPVSAVALTDGEVLELPRAGLENLLRADADLGEALDQAVRRGLARLDRDDGALNAHPLDEGGSLLAQIRRFLVRRFATPADPGR